MTNEPASGSTGPSEWPSEWKQVAQSEHCGSDMLDFVFRCSHCIKLIGDGAPVYMRHDSPYCSTHCRNKGVSGLYTRLRDTQLQEVAKLSSISLSSVGSRSDNSICSRATGFSGTSGAPSGISETTNSQQNLGPLARFGKRMLNHILWRVASNSWGDKVLRTYSTGVMKGRDMTQHSSVGQTLFSYLPAVDQYLAKSSSGSIPHCESWASSGKCSSVDSETDIAGFPNEMSRREIAVA